jgi:hypothetical protein
MSYVLIPRSASVVLMECTASGRRIINSSRVTKGLKAAG